MLLIVLFKRLFTCHLPTFTYIFQGLTPFRRPLFRPLEASWGPHEWLLEPSGGVLGPLGGILGPRGGSGVTWGSFWSRLKAVLGFSWALLGSSWGHLGVSWGLLGPSWGRLEPSWGHLGAIFGTRCLQMILHSSSMPGPADCARRLNLLDNSRSM